MSLTSYITRQFSGDSAKDSAQVAADSGWQSEPGVERMGFFTDTSICIGCKACEVACKEWNQNPQDGEYLASGYSYDNTRELSADTWRHVAFVEQSAERIEAARESGRRLVDLGMPAMPPKSQPDEIKAAGGSTTYATNAPDTMDPGAVSVFELAQQPGGLTPTQGAEVPDFRWLMASDVCKHCTHAGCLDNCPTGALMRTEFGTVVVQADVCNGCGYCVGGCPFGVVERRKGDKTVEHHGNAQKCTLCYDRLKEGQTPACAQTCPTTSIKFGTHEEMVRLAEERVTELHQRGLTEARLYGANTEDGVGGTGSVFLLLDEPEVYGLPPDPVAPSYSTMDSYKRMLLAAGGMTLVAGLASLLGGGA